MKLSTIIVVIMAVLTPPIVVPPAIEAIKNRSPIATADVVEAAPAPVVAMLPAKAVEHHALTSSIMGVAAHQDRPATSDIERCARILSTIKIPNRQSITDDMDAMKDAAINSANARLIAGQRCLRGLR